MRGFVFRVSDWCERGERREKDAQVQKQEKPPSGSKERKRNGFLAARSLALAFLYGGGDGNDGGGSGITAAHRARAPPWWW